jgi:hypothetical protein
MMPCRLAIRTRGFILHVVVGKVETSNLGALLPWCIAIWQGRGRGGRPFGRNGTFQPTQSALPTVNDVPCEDPEPQLPMQRRPLPWEWNTIRRHGELPSEVERQI